MPKAPSAKKLFIESVIPVITNVLAASSDETQFADATTLAEQFFKGWRASLRAVIPGRQQKGNLDDVLHTGHKAFKRYMKV